MPKHKDRSRSKSRKIDDQAVEEAILAGKSDTEIAKEQGVNCSTIGRYRHHRELQLDDFKWFMANQEHAHLLKLAKIDLAQNYILNELLENDGVKLKQLSDSVKKDWFAKLTIASGILIDKISSMKQVNITNNSISVIIQRVHAKNKHKVIEHDKKVDNNDPEVIVND